MRRIFRNLSIRWKIVVVAMIAATLALTLACGGFAIYDFFSFREQVVHELAIHADIVGANSTAAIMFGNETDAAQILGTLDAESDIQAACIYGENNKILAVYRPDKYPEVEFPKVPISDAYYLGNNTLEVYRPVVMDGKHIGIVYIRMGLDQLYARTKRYAEIGGTLLLLALLAAFLFANRLQQNVSEPIQHLATTARAITAQKNYLLRAQKAGEDELGVLTMCFNEMLDQIQLRDKDLERSREDAEAASKAKSEFLATMSHEIRTPLNGVIGTVQLLLDTELGAQQRRYAQLARASGDALLALINDVLDFSKIEAGKMELELIDLHPQKVAEEVLDILGPRAARKGLDLACHVATDVCRSMRGDPDRLRQILANLVTNAIKFTEKGAVVVRVRNMRETASHIILRFTITDTGPGIPKDRMDRLFQSFSQVDASTTRKHGGTGLGLAISKQLVKMMGGQIGVESELGKGTTFWFTVQLEKTGAAPTLETPERPDLRVLVVTQSSLHAQVFGEQLESWGFIPSAISDATQTLDVLKAAKVQAKPISIVICDSSLEIDALQLSRTIRNCEEAGKPLVMLLTNFDEHIEQRALVSAGISACILKPVHQSQLFDTIMNALAQGTSPGHVPVHVRDTNVFARSEHIHGARILVAEDNEVNQVVTGEMLTKLGCTFEIVTTGLAAFDQAMTGKFDLVLMDCHMPELDGFEATQRIRAAEQTNGGTRLPIVALTANAIKGDRERCLAAGMDAYVTKPINVNALVSAMEGLLANRPKVSGPHTTPVEAAVSPVAPITQEPEEGSSPFDVATVLERCMSDAGVLKRVLEKFAEQAPLTLADLRKRLAANEAQELTRVAHGMKGAAANVAAEKLRTLALEIEQMGKKSELAGVEGLLREMEMEITRCVSYIPVAVEAAKRR